MFTDRQVFANNEDLGSNNYFKWAASRENIFWVSDQIWHKQDCPTTENG